MAGNLDIEASMNVDSKICANPDCGVQFFRRDNEPAYRWRDRSTCSKACGAAVGGMRGKGVPKKDHGVSIGLLAATSSQMFAAHNIVTRN
jgi:hypothetical protein